jgi:large subunit ribosomal protein L29
MEAKELREISAEDLVQKQASLRDEIGHLKLQRVTGRLENPMKLRQVKKDLARVETILRERALQSQKGRE